MPCEGPIPIRMRDKLGTIPSLPSLRRQGSSSRRHLGRGRELLMCWVPDLRCARPGRRGASGKAYHTHWRHPRAWTEDPLLQALLPVFLDCRDKPGNDEREVCFQRHGRGPTIPTAVIPALCGDLLVPEARRRMQDACDYFPISILTHGRELRRPRPADPGMAADTRLPAKAICKGPPLVAPSRLSANQLSLVSGPKMW